MVTAEPHNLQPQPATPKMEIPETAPEHTARRPAELSEQIREGGTETVRDSALVEQPADHPFAQNQSQREMEPVDGPLPSIHDGVIEEASVPSDSSDSSPREDACETAALMPDTAPQPEKTELAPQVPAEEAGVECVAEPVPAIAPDALSESAFDVVQNARAPEPQTRPDGGLVWTLGKRSDGQGTEVRRKVLVIDDDPVIRMLLTMGLGTRGYECVTAENGKVAQELLQTFRPDVMVVDLLMPVMDGLSFLQWLRAEAGDTTPVVVLTNVSDPKIQEDARACGADAILCKPLQLTNLLQEMNKLVPV